MKTINEILKQIDDNIEKPLVSAQFGDMWKSHAIDHYDFPDVVNIAWKQGRRAILLEKALREVYAQFELQSQNTELREELPVCKHCGLSEFE